MRVQNCVSQSSSWGWQRAPVNSAGIAGITRATSLKGLLAQERNVLLLILNGPTDGASPALFISLEKQPLFFEIALDDVERSGQWFALLLAELGGNGMGSLGE